MTEETRPTESDTQAIMRLLSDYGRLLDLRDGAGWAGLFLPDGEWVGGDHYGVIAGREKLAQFVASEFAGTPPCVHMFGNFAIEVDGDTATVWSRWLLVEQRDGGLTPALAGSYSDVLARTGGGWRFRRREVALDLPAGD